MVIWMSQDTKNLLLRYIDEVKKIYGVHLKQVILYGSYARGDFNEESDIDIMILVDISDLDIKQYFDQISDFTFDFNLDNDLDIKPITKNLEHFMKWKQNYPFYSSISKEGVMLYGAA